MTSMLRVFTFLCYALLDLGATWCFMMPYVASRFENLPKCLLDPFSILTYITEFIQFERIYKDCVVSIYHRDTLTNLIELEMVDY